MSYLVLARKFRPQTFQSIAGQEHISRALANAILRDRVPHALLFTGPRGVGKTTSARVFARALNCTGRALPSAESLSGDADGWLLAEPCGTCTNCVEIAKSASMAVWEIDGASNNSVDNVREVIESLRSLPPHGSEYKIYIIDEVHMLSVPAFNALLKSLEEPPPQTVFIFATTEPHKIPETVISRCQRHDFRRLTQDTIIEQLSQIAEKEKVTVAPEVLSFVARRAQGGMRDAQSMLDRLIASAPEGVSIQHARSVFGVMDEGFYFEQSLAVLEQDAEACFLQLDQAFRQSIDVRAFVTDFLAHWRNLMLLAVALEKQNGARANESALQRMLELGRDDFQRYLEQVQKLSSFDALRLFDIAEATADQALRSNFPRYVMEAGLAKMASLPSLRPLPEVLSELERVVGQGGGARISASAPAAAAAERDRPALAATDSAASARVGASSSGVSSAEFNPIWQEFIAHLKARKAPRLEAFLKRVSPKHFSSGTLVVEGDAFVLDSLRDADTLRTLRDALASYSEVERWDIQLIDYKADDDAAGAALNGEAASSKQNGFVPGSLVALEAEARKERRQQIDQEARKSASVKQVLSVFEGSTIERVEPLEQ